MKGKTNDTATDATILLLLEGVLSLISHVGSLTKQHKLCDANNNYLLIYMWLCQHLFTDLQNMFIIMIFKNILLTLLSIIIKTLQQMIWLSNTDIVRLLCGHRLSGNRCIFFRAAIVFARIPVWGANTTQRQLYNICYNIYRKKCILSRGA